LQGKRRDGSDGTRTRDLRRDSSAPCFAARSRRSPLVARCAAFPVLALPASTTGCRRCVPRTFQSGCAPGRGLGPRFIWGDGTRTWDLRNDRPRRPRRPKSSETPQSLMDRGDSRASPETLAEGDGLVPSSEPPHLFRGAKERCRRLPALQLRRRQPHRGREHTADDRAPPCPSRRAAAGDRADCREARSLRRPGAAKRRVPAIY
jgi:hypothetical protein